MEYTFRHVSGNRKSGRQCWHRAQKSAEKANGLFEFFPSRNEQNGRATFCRRQRGKICNKRFRLFAAGTRFRIEQLSDRTHIDKTKPALRDQKTAAQSDGSVLRPRNGCQKAV